jgi:hypothetical protein
MAFNLERRSKTPNILQYTHNSNTSYLSNNNSTNCIQNPASRSSANLTSLNQSYNHHQQQQPTPPPQQLRSKTPTTDRLLFQHSNPITHDYIYLNGASHNNNNNNNNRVEHLIEHHIPLYDQTTQIQHQRVVHGHKIPQSSNGINSQFANRSKTPGPDMIYFKNGGSNEFSSTTNNNYINRSKTPTADIMFYPKSSPKQQHSHQEHISAGNYAAQTLPPYDIDDLIALVLNNEVSLITDVDGNYYLEMVIDLHRQETGFGFRIVGGEEEGSQVSVGYIVNAGSAHIDGRLKPNDEIIMIDNECVLGATHRRVVQLMTIAGLNRRVKLMIRRKLNYQQYKILLNAQQQQIKTKYISNNNENALPVILSNGSNGVGVSYPYTVTLFRNNNEGFGFVIISTLHKNGPSIGKS